MTEGTSNIGERLVRVRERIAEACVAAGREPADVSLLAVSKAHPTESIREAYAAGLRVFGENYAQELAKKADALSDLEGLRWRFIGHLQRNKIKFVERARATIDTVDSSRLAEAISARHAKGGEPLEVLLQVNVGREPQKSGCLPEDLPTLVDAVRALPGVDLRGLMTVAPHFEDPMDARPTFAALRELAEAHSLPELSMGMTHDLEAAIFEGATMVRLGTALFGPRPTATR
jgi:pyridoxal phosphate enzyme (YggS family)